MIQTEFNIGIAVLDLSYLVAAVLFVTGLKMLSNPVKARSGNLSAGAGMLLATITTLFLHKDGYGHSIAPENIKVILVTVAAGSSIGWIIARKVRMTAMPQMVSFYNATGGAASGLVALIKFGNPDNSSSLVTLLGMTVGIFAFSGSLVAFGKLNGNIKDWFSPVMKYVNLIMLLLVAGLIVKMMLPGTDEELARILIFFLFGSSLIYGILFVMPIGGADMPVVISLLNSFTGIAVAMAGFIYSNQAMLLGGILVGSAGSLLTILMCKAMNRSLFNVIIGAFGANKVIAEQKSSEAMLEISQSDTAILLNYSHKVVIIPGYGLAVAQAQHLCSELDRILSDRGVEVSYAIHPVAGRMPGHMNVLLAEANVPYEKLVEMDHINPDMATVDVAMVIGANDVVNPAALNDPASPIYGMPIIHAHEARNIIVIKRGLGKGYAAIENNLFYNKKTRMLFGNAKEVLQKLIEELKGMD